MASAFGGICTRQKDCCIIFRESEAFRSECWARWESHWNWRGWSGGPDNLCSTTAKRKTLGLPTLWWAGVGITGRWGPVRSRNGWQSTIGYQCWIGRWD